MLDKNTFIRDIYTKLILTAISRRRDFSRLVRQADYELELIKQLNKDNKNGFPEGYVGLLYVEILARNMESSLGDVYNLSQERKKEIIEWIVDYFTRVSACDCYYDDSKRGEVEFRGELCVFDIVDDNESRLNIDQAMGVIDRDYKFFSYYWVTFYKKFEEDPDKGWYSITLSCADDYHSDYIYDSFELWSGEDGPYVDFIESVIRDRDYGGNISPSKELHGPIDEIRFNDDLDNLIKFDDDFEEFIKHDDNDDET